MNLSTDFITDGNKLNGSAMPRILANAQDLLVGRTIKAVGYAPGADDRPWPCIVLDNGTTLTVSKDDEGNGPGSLFIYHAAEETGEILCATSIK